MKSLTMQEFTERMDAIQRAERIFIESGLTNNITVAFRIYQEIFAERERQLFISEQYGDFRPGGRLARYERIPCPDCDSNMYISLIEKDQEGNTTKLTCSKCGTVLLSDKSLDEWMEALKRREDAT